MSRRRIRIPRSSQPSFFKSPAPIPPPVHYNNKCFGFTNIRTANSRRIEDKEKREAPVIKSMAG
jgi:hypothetical protein